MDAPHLLRFAPRHRTALLLAGVVSLLTFSPAALSRQCGQDGFEPNDSCTSPFLIGTPFVQSGLSVHRLSDEDHFRVTVRPGEVMNVSVAFAHQNGDIDVFLYDPSSSECGSPFEHLRAGTSTTDGESLSWNNPSSTARDVVIKVLVFPGSLTACNNYDITVTTALPQDPCDPLVSDDSLEQNDSCADARPLPLGLTSGLWASRDDSDFYSHTLGPGATLDIQAFFVDNISDIDLYLYRADGPCGGGFQSGELVNGFTQTDNERVIWSNTTGSPIDVVLEVDVFNDDSCNSYTLDVNLGGGGIGRNYCQANSNSSGQSGLMRAQGSVSIASNDVTLRATQLPQQQFGIFVVSDTQGFESNPGGSTGNLCLGGQIGRYNTDIQSSGASGLTELRINLNQLRRPTGVAQAVAGDTWYFQFWHRDVSPLNSNLTNGLSITFQP